MKILINEWQEHLLKDYIIYEDDRIVCEEKGISEEVRIAAYSTLDKIKSQILSNVDKFVDISKYKTKLYNGSFKVNEFSKDININYSCYFFEDKDLGQEFFNQNIDNFDTLNIENKLHQFYIYDKEEFKRLLKTVIYNFKLKKYLYNLK